MSSANLWQVFSAAPPTTAPMVRIATGTATKTHLFITAIDDLTIVSWGVCFDTAPTVFVNAELISTTTVAPTGGTTVAATNLRGDTVAATNKFTAAFGPSAEGTVVATTKTFDAQTMLGPEYDHEWSLGREPILAGGQVLRVRLSTTVSVQALCWINVAG